MKIEYFPHTLHFKFPAGTSRGVLHQRTSWYIVIRQQGITGIGEAGPLPGLSLDDRPDFAQQLGRICGEGERKKLPDNALEAFQLSEELCGNDFPSVRFALETAFLDYLNGGQRLIFKNDFYKGQIEIPINGLIWMGDKESMRQRMKEKLEDGYSCLKMKIGAIHFEDECEILGEIRNHFSPEELSLRVDANGAFTAAEAPQKLQRLTAFGIHSIEQPIRQGQANHMHNLCRTSPVAIALDEELIGVPVKEQGRALLMRIRPQYIILKPGLLGGFSVCREWIVLAEELGIGWWMTSALEANIGLNAICQFTAEYAISMPQGLGTGQLYYNNIPSPLRIERGMIKYVYTV